MCFKCAGSGTQKSRPSVSSLWRVFDSNGEHVYNVRAQNEAQAIRIANVNYGRASEEFRAAHDMTNAKAICGK